MLTLTLILQSSVALAAALVAVFAFRRRSAALRHFVLASGVAAVIAAAAFARVAPAWEVVVPPAAVQAVTPVALPLPSAGAAAVASDAAAPERAPVPLVYRRKRNAPKKG